ncbi:nucleoside phosphorylase domain-containing protein [Trichoderma chlorosporum]
MEIREFNDRLHERKVRFHSDYTVGWVCALIREQSAAKFMLDEIHDSKELSNPANDDNTYIRGSIGGHNIVIACLPMGQTGTSKAASVATRMIATFVNIKVGLMVGIGGGMPQSDVRLGDVVISSPEGKSSGVVQWDFGKAESGGTFRRKGSLNKPPTALLTALGNVRSDSIKSYDQVDAYLRDLETRHDVPKSFLSPGGQMDILYQSSYPHVEEKKATGGDRWETKVKGKIGGCALCDKTKVVEREPKTRHINFHYGLIASGNQVIKDALVRNEVYDNLLKDLDAEVLCVEMEAAGLDDFPCLVIRGISDYADSHKNDAWQDYAACVAAAFAKVLLNKLPASEVSEMKAIQDLFPHGFLEKAKEIIKPWFFSESKVESSNASPQIDARQNLPEKSYGDQAGERPAKSFTSHESASENESNIINTQPILGEDVSGEHNIPERPLSLDNSNPRRDSLRSSKTNSEINIGGSQAQLDSSSQNMNNDSQSKDIFDDKSVNFEQDGSKFERFSGQRIGQRDLKRLLLDAVELIV